MRELKFRAWDGKEMKPAFDLTQNPKFWWEENKDYPLMQFTGLKDKNGEEIYEGDLIEFNNNYFDITAGHLNDEIIVGEVQYHFGSWELVEFNGQSHDFYISLVNDEEVKIIGNIYEHSHLLEGDSDV